MSIGSCDCCDAARVPVHNVVWNGMDVTTCYLCQGDVFDPYDEMVEVECQHCRGEGEIIFETGIDRRDGSIMEHGYRCTECDGRGGVWIEAEPITCDELEFAA
jgi:DnaJ-class molecular chaperone